MRADAPLLRRDAEAPGAPDQPVVVYETTHGPVVGYATVGGKRVAISAQRSTRGREVLSARAFYELNTARVTSAQQLPADDERGRVQLQLALRRRPGHRVLLERAASQRATGTDPALPTLGTGEYDWRGFLPFEAHARAINPPSGVILNWNNRPAAGFGAADSNFSYGSVHRVELLRRAIAGRRTHTLAGVTAATNAAATQDLRVVEVWPAIRDVLRTGSAPSARAEAAAGLLDAWRTAGEAGSTAISTGRSTTPGAAVLDAAWPRLADAVLSPALGPLVARLAQLHGRSNNPGPGGSAYLSGWYGYVDKDLRTLLGEPVRAPFSRRYCGAGVLETCREALWAALDAAAAELERRRDPAPSVVARGRDGRTDPLHLRRTPGHHALDEPADVPAGDVVQRPPPRGARLSLRWRASAT